MNKTVFILLYNKLENQGVDYETRAVVASSGRER